MARTAITQHSYDGVAGTQRLCGLHSPHTVDGRGAAQEEAIIPAAAAAIFIYVLAAAAPAMTSGQVEVETAEPHAHAGQRKLLWRALQSWAMNNYPALYICKS